MGRLYGSLFLHANMHYAEIPAAKLPELVARSYVPAFEALLARKGVKAAVEFSGYSLQWLAEHSPQVIDMVRALAARGDAELMGSTYADPILPLLPPDDGVRQIEQFRTVYDRLFGDIQPQVKGMYVQEYALDASVVDLLARMGLEWVVLSSGHYKVSKRGLLNSALQRIPPQEEFAAGEPVARPYDVVGARGTKVAAVTWNMPGPNDLIHAYKDGRATWAEVEGYFASLQARYCSAQDGFILVTPADTEFLGDMPPQGSIPPAKWGEILDQLAGAQNLELVTPSVFLASHPEREALYLKCGAGARFSDLQNWTVDPDNARLNYLCDDARSQIRLAESMIDLVDALGFRATEAQALLDDARAHLLHADNSDGRGWKPLPERRLDCYNHALEARDQAVAALSAATAAVRKARS
jgi:alpha-amylase/alpha-mannosidase (GH57 family)